MINIKKLTPVSQQCCIATVNIVVNVGSALRVSRSQHASNSARMLPKDYELASAVPKTTSRLRTRHTAEDSRPHLRHLRLLAILAAPLEFRKRWQGVQRRSPARQLAIQSRQLLCQLRVQALGLRMLRCAQDNEACTSSSPVLDCVRHEVVRNVMNTDALNASAGVHRLHKAKCSHTSAKKKYESTGECTSAPDW